MSEADRKSFIVICLGALVSAPSIVAALYAEDSHSVMVGGISCWWWCAVWASVTSAIKGFRDEKNKEPSPNE